MHDLPTSNKVSVPVGTLEVRGRRITIIPQIVKPRITQGVDYGAESVVLLQDDKGRQIIRVPGHRTWKSTLVGSTYDPASVWFEPPGAVIKSSKRLLQGRLSKEAFIEGVAEELPALFNLPKACGRDLSLLVYRAWKSKQTVVIEKKQPE